MAKTKFFCVAVEGATTDGRAIDANWINEMAANYAPATYTATVNVEHIRGYSPEPPFNNYGHVLAAEARDIEIVLNGKPEKRRALFAQLDANDQLVELNRKGQKLFSSIEINPNFAGKGQAYLQGLAVTDNPASLGTEMLQFAAKAPVNPFTVRKTNPSNLFSATGEPIALELDAEAPKSPGGFDFAAAFADLKAAFSNKTPPAAPPAADQTKDDFSMTAVAEGFSKMETIIASFASKVEQAQGATDANVRQLQSEFAGLKADLEKTPGPSFTQRPPATGGDGAVLTDC